MKPAFSVLFFTVTSGFGYGMLIWLFALQILGSDSLTPSELILAGIVGLIFATLGLLSSSLHLANPKNAWRAFSRFRTSWLSREGVFALLFYLPSCAALIWVYLGYARASLLFLTFVVLALLLALAVIVCTGMIYESLKPIRQWHNRLVTPIYLFHGFYSGALLLLVILMLFSTAELGLIKTLALLLAVFCAALKLLYWFSIGRPEGASIQDATGFSQAQVRLLDAGHNADTFLSREFGYTAQADKLVLLRYVALALAYLLPAISLLVVPPISMKAAVLFAFSLAYIGLLAERWLFFAEARHVVRLYHGDQRC